MPSMAQFPRGRSPLMVHGMAKLDLKGTRRSPPMFDTHIWALSGQTVDGTGSALGNCQVHLFYTSSDVEAAMVQSDASGNFTFLIGPNAGPFYCVAYLPGSPDKAGTTVNTLLPT